MADLVVTVPKWFWSDWIAEGDAAGEPETGQSWGFTIGAPKWRFDDPPIFTGERLYIVAHGRLRGYAPVVDVQRYGATRLEIIRKGGAVACTIAEPIPGFRGYRKVWWDRSAELPFPDWRTAGVPDGLRRR